MGSHIPGNPTILPQNMDGASGVKATNYIYNVAPRDGTTFAGVHNSVPTAPQLSPDGVQYDVGKLNWIGNITQDPFVGYLATAAPINKLEEAMSKEVILGANTPGTPDVDYALISNALFGTKFKVVSGYKSLGDINLAMERGEVHGNFAVSWSSFKTTSPKWKTEGKLKLLDQYGLTKHPEIPEVPLFIDLAKNDADREALQFVLARQDFSKPYIAPPEVPPARLAALRKAFDETIKDPKFLEAAAKANLDVDRPMQGPALAQMIGKLAATPAPLVERMTKILTAPTAAK